MFTSARRPGRPVTDDGDSSQWRKILAAAGVPHTRRYSSRHTAASVLIGHGVDPASVAAILGHNDPGFTMRTYVHGIDERVTAAVSALDRVQDKVQEPEDAPRQ
ncbi:tyrosine-type recombinase/integrase [Microbacterium sp. BWT-B31]|uniref:tyrosine-type recombinase/integrase n=1 Tax=Microbacterium sp. BWT-B31 TaxID=3232072 RepID=UPI003526CE9D